MTAPDIPAISWVFIAFGIGFLLGALWAAYWAGVAASLGRIEVILRRATRLLAGGDDD